MIVLNFSHPLTDAHRSQIEEISGSKIETVYDIPVQFDEQAPFAEQIVALADRFPVDSRTLQTEPILVVMPSLNFIAVSLLAWLNGQMGYFPTILRMRPKIGAIPRSYEPAEMIDLQSLREEARKRRDYGK